MAIRSFLSNAKQINAFFNFVHSPTLKLEPCYSTLSSFTHHTSTPPLTDLVNDLSRVLSDHRDPHHDLELSLSNFSSHISTDLVEQVLKRCKNLGFSAHRFFLWAKQIPGFQHSRESYRILVDILGSDRKFAILWDFLIEMRETPGFQISPDFFWLVFRAYSRANLPNDAIRAFDRMVEFGLKASVDDLDQLLYVFCKRKHVKHAQDFFDRVKHRFEPHAKSYSILVRGWGDVGDSAMACKVFEEMAQRGCTADVPAYNSLLEALCKAGNVHEAYKMFTEMRSNGVEPDACSYSIFIRVHCEQNDVYSAFRVLDRMKRYNLVPNVFTYNCIIKRLCRNEKVEEAYHLLNEMVQMSVSPDTWSYNAIIAYHCDHCEVNRATKLISQMVKEGCPPDRHSYNMVLKLLVRVGRFDRAAEIWERMGEWGFYPSVSTYAVMVHGLCKKKGKLEEACRYFEMMIDEGIPPYSSTVQMLRNQLIGLGLIDNLEILASKMEQGTSCSIQELAKAMRGNKACVGSRNEDTDSESD